MEGKGKKEEKHSELGHRRPQRRPLKRRRRRAKGDSSLRNQVHTRGKVWTGAVTPSVKPSRFTGEREMHVRGGKKLGRSVSSRK